MKNSDNKACNSAVKVTETENEWTTFQFNNTLANVASQSVFINASNMARRLEKTFENDDNLIGVIIIDADERQLMGMISRERFMELYSKPFRKELYCNKPLNLIVKEIGRA